MRFKNPNIGLGVAFSLMVLGLLVVGRDASDAEAGVVYGVAMAIGIAVYFVLDIRDERRRDQSRSAR